VYLDTIREGSPESVTSSNLHRWDEKMSSGTLFQVSWGNNFRICVTGLGITKKMFLAAEYCRRGVTKVCWKYQH
jgi:hypothetical protein